MSNSQTTQVTDSPYQYNSPIIRELLEVDKGKGLDKPNKKIISIKYNETVYFNQNESLGRNNKNRKKEIKVEKYLDKIIPQNINPINFNVNINNNYYTSYALPNSKRINNYSSQADFDNNDEVNPLFIGVPCMNCGNCIQIDNIERHSVTCTKVSEEIIKNEQSNVGLYSINYKIKKLKEHLTMISNGTIEVPFKIGKEMKGATQTLINFVQSVSNMETIGLSTIKEFKMIMKGLDELSNKYKGIMSAMILIDRTKVLVNEKTKIFKEQYRLLKHTKETNNQKTGSLNSEEKVKQDLAIQSNKQFDIDEEIEEEYDHKQKKKKTNGKVSTNMIDEIVSDIEKRSCIMSNTSLSSIAMGKDDEEFINDNEVHLDFSSINSDKMKEKKAFFKTVLRLKFEKFHSTHLGQKISQKALYNEVKKNNLPRDKWNDFIVNELKNPNKYIQDKAERLSKPMDVIEEER